MSIPWRWVGKRVLLLVAIHELVGWLLAWSDTIGGAFSPGPYAIVGVSLAMLFVLVRLTLWLLVLPTLVAGGVVELMALLSRRRAASGDATP